MIKLYHRSDAKEYIDDFQIDPATLRQTYQQLKSVNDATLGYWPTMSAVKYFLHRYGRGREIKILDIGCGDGETLRRIDDYGRANKFSLKLKGIDLSREVIAAAIDATVSQNIDFIHGDALDSHHHEIYDLVISSLTMHHLKDKEIVRLIRWMGLHARLGWFISDLHRHALAYYFIKYFVKAARFNFLMCHDAPLSVARGFRRHEWETFLKEAGLHLNGANIFWYPNFRYAIRHDQGKHAGQEEYEK